MGSNALAFELTADSVGFDAAMKRAEKSAGALGGKVSADFKNIIASVASYEAFKGLIGNTISAVKEIRDFSKQAGISTDEVQQLQKAASKTGLEFEDFQTGLSKMGVARRSAAEDDQKLLNFFNKWGISLVDLENPQLRNIDLLKKMSHAMQGVTLTSAQRTEFRDVFGKSGEKLVESIGLIDHLGPIKIIEQQDVEAIYQADRDLQKLWKTVQKFGAPTLAGFASTVTKGLTGEGDLPEEVIFKKLKKGQIPNTNDVLRMLGQVAASSWGPGALAVGGARGDQLAKALGFGRSEGPGVEVMEKNLTDHKSSRKGKEDALQETTLNEQWRRFYDLLDKEYELSQRVKKINFEMLTPKEQQLDLQQRINALLKESDDILHKPFSVAEPTTDDIRAAQSKRDEAAALNEQLLGTISKPNIPHADSAAAAGGFIGGAVNFNPQNYQSRELINLTQQIRDNTARIGKDNPGPFAPALFAP